MLEAIGNEAFAQKEVLRCRARGEAARHFKESRACETFEEGRPAMLASPGRVLLRQGRTLLVDRHGCSAALRCRAGRKKALQGMEADERWLKGAGPDYDKLRGVFSKLIEQVRNLREGAFAPFFEQSLVRAILVALGGAGGVQLIELLMHART